MILYLDTSALLKKYFKEKGSDDVVSMWKKTSAIVTSTVAYAETLASVCRKRRETGEIGQGPCKTILSSFHKDWQSFIHVDVTNSLNEIIDKLTITHPLRGFDAIHLASALIVYEKIQESFLFVCYDKKLIKAAREEGLHTFPENL